MYVAVSFSCLQAAQAKKEKEALKKALRKERKMLRAACKVRERKREREQLVLASIHHALKYIDTDSQLLCQR